MKLDIGTPVRFRDDETVPAAWRGRTGTVVERFVEINPRRETFRIDLGPDEPAAGNVPRSHLEPIGPTRPTP
jgi:hypothetical protein